MKVQELHDQPKVERDANGEVIPPCIGVKHWWYYVTPRALKCKKCGAIKYAPAGRPR